jgi:hypothetical protein
MLCLHQSLLGSRSQQGPRLLTLLLAGNCLTPNPWWQLCLFSAATVQSYFTTGDLLPISSSWHQAPWGSLPEDFSLQLNPCSQGPYVTSSLMRGWVCLLRICLAFVKCTYCTYSILLKFLPFALYTISLSVQALQSRSCLSYVCDNGSIVTWTVVSLSIAKFKPLIFSVSGFALSYAENMFILMILYVFCLLYVKSCYIIIYIWQVESRVKIKGQCAPWKISNDTENLVLQALQF